MPFLDDLIGIHDLSVNGDPPVKRRALLNFVGTSVVIEDDPIVGATNVTVSSIAGTTITTLVSGTVNDLAPSGIGSAAVVRVNATAVTTLTGLSFQANQYPRPMLVNVGTFTVTIQHQSTSSGAIHRIITPSGTNYLLLPGATVELVRDEVDSRWRVVSL